MICKNCGSLNLDQQGYVVVGQDREESWAEKFLKDKIYTCLSCGGTFGFKEEQK